MVDESSNAGRGTGKNPISAARNRRCQKRECNISQCVLVRNKNRNSESGRAARPGKTGDYSGSNNNRIKRVGIRWTNIGWRAKIRNGDSEGTIPYCYHIASVTETITVQVAFGQGLCAASRPKISIVENMAKPDSIHARNESIAIHIRTGGVAGLGKRKEWRNED